jgi:TfoX/Sxy family transcriptional regulator of competence genes
MSPKKAKMPKWKPPPPALTALFEERLAGIPGAESRKMFGYLAGFVGGNMFSGIFQDSIVLRLSSGDRSEFLDRIGGAPFSPMPGRPMREYVVAPKSLLARPEELQEWIEEAFAYVASMPEKAPAPNTPRPPKAGTTKKGRLRRAGTL